MAEDIEKRTFDCFNAGFHCAESMTKTILDLNAAEPNDGMIKAASGFGGGIGATRKDVCGALSGGIIAIGYLHGRIESGGDNQISTDLAAKFRQRFVEEFGSTNCDVILAGLGQQERGDKCKSLTATAAKLLTELLADVETDNARGQQ